MTLTVLTYEQQQAIFAGTLVRHARDCAECGMRITLVAPPELEIEDERLCTSCAAELAGPGASP